MRREEMLSAARAVFAEKGYARATLEEIAQRAEFGKGTLYNYFEGGKEGILYAILDEIFDEIVDLVENAFGETTSFRGSLSRFMLDCMSLFDSRRDLFIILMKEMHRMILSDDPDRSRYIHGQHHRVIDALVPHLRRAQEVGEIREFDPVAVAHTIFGNLNGVQMHMCLYSCTEPGGAPSLTPSSAADFLTSLLLDGLLEERLIDASTSAS